MGQFDLVPGVLQECGVQVHFHKMKTKPAKPSLFGTVPDGPAVFALPGNPISAFVGFWLLARPALAAMQGRRGELPRLWPARLKGRLKAAGDRVIYTPARVVAGGAELRVEPARWGGSGDPFGMACADAMIVQPVGAPAASDGDPVEIVLFDAP
jgi:molybdopterin molybdotransferase